MKSLSLVGLPALVLFLSRYQHVDGTLDLVSALIGSDKSPEKETAYEEKKSVPADDGKTKEKSKPQFNQTQANWKFSADISEVVLKSPTYQAVPSILIQLLLSLFIYGAKDDTLQQLTNALHYDHVNWIELCSEEKERELSLILSEIDKAIDVSLNVNIGLFVSDECHLNADFQKFIRKCLPSTNITIGTLDSKQANVDNWVNGLLANNVVKLRGGDVKGGSAFVLAGGIQQNDVFNSVIQNSLTHEGLFHLPGGQGSFVNYATTLEGGLSCYTENNDYTAFVLPIGETQVLVHVPKSTDVGCLSADLDIEAVLKRCKPKNIRISFPRHVLKKQDDLHPLFSTLGVTSLFDPDCTDLKNIFGTKEKLYIIDATANVIHSIFGGGANANNVVIANGNSDYGSFCTSDDALISLDRPFLLHWLRNSQVTLTLLATFGTSSS